MIFQAYFSHKVAFQLLPGYDVSRRGKPGLLPAVQAGEEAAGQTSGYSEDFLRIWVFCFPSFFLFLPFFEGFLKQIQVWNWRRNEWNWRSWIANTLTWHQIHMGYWLSAIHTILSNNATVSGCTLVEIQECLSVIYSTHGSIILTVGSSKSWNRKIWGRLNGPVGTTRNGFLSMLGRMRCVEQRLTHKKNVANAIG